MVAVYPFAEEMNKTRRMIALGARALAASGFAVIQLDLFGCGDSSGELHLARWDDWLDDIDQSLDWLQQRYACPLWLWGTRAGCLVAADAARRSSRKVNFLFWQPQISGRQVLQQFLRLKMASQIQHGSTRGLTSGLLKDLESGRPVEVAGYRLATGITQGLSASSLMPTLQPAAVCWFEVTTRDPVELLPGGAPVLDAWRASNFEVTAQAVGGPPFWQTLEIEDAPELSVATVRALVSHAQSAMR